MADVYLAFGAETGEMESALARAQAAVKATTAEMRSLANEMVSTGASADSALGSQLNALGGKLAEAKEHVAGLKDQLKETGDNGGGFIGKMVEGVTGFLSPLTEMKAGLGELAEVVAAAFAVEKIAEFVRQMGEAGEATERTSKIMGMTPEQVEVMNYQFAMTGTHIENLDQLLGRFELNLAKAQSGTTPMAAGLQALGLSVQDLIGLKPDEQMEKIADAVSKFEDSPTKMAAVQALGRGFVELIPILDRGAEGWKEYTAAAEAAGSKIAAAASGPEAEMNHQITDMDFAMSNLTTAAFMPFIGVVDGVVQTLRDMAVSLQEDITQGGLLGETLFAIATALRIVVTAVDACIMVFKILWNVIEGAMKVAQDSILGVALVIKAFFEDVLSGSMRTWPALTAQVKASSEKIASDFKVSTQSILGDISSMGVEMKKLWESWLTDGKAAIDGVQTEAGKPLGGGEGGAGAGGRTVPELDETPWGKATREVANLTAELQRLQDQLEGKRTALDTGFFDERKQVPRLHTEELAPAFANALEKAVKDAEAATGQKAVFTSLARTNAEQQEIWERSAHGTKFAAAPPGESMHEVGGAVDIEPGAVLTWLREHISEYPQLEHLHGNYDPVHIQSTLSREELLRSKAEDKGAAGPPPTGEEREKLLQKQKDLNLELDKAKQKLIDIKTEEAGGTEVSKAKLKADQEDAVAKGDQLKHAQEALAAAKADQAAGAGGTEEKRRELADKVAEAEKKVSEAMLKQQEAASKLEIAKAKAANDTEREKKAELDLADAKIKAAGADKAAHDAAEADKINIEKRYADQATQLALQKDNEELASARTTAANKIKDIDLEFRAKSISESQKVAMTKAALAEEIAAERSIFAEELKLDNLRPAERQKILAELAAAEEKYAQQVKETQLKAAEDSSKAWQGMADKISSTLSSQVDGIINGTTTVKQAFSNMAKGIIEDVIKYAIKWAVEHAFASSQVMAQNAAVTASTIASQTAQDAAKTASSGVGTAMQAAEAVKSIAIDGAKTFGGVFGFLAPLLGPFAAGPAAGAEATVLAAGSAFDTGAWNLPRDMIAAVHAGEMVIPSRGGVADEFRGFLSGGGFDRMGRGDAVPSGGNRSVAVNPAVHFNVSAIDGQSAASFFQSNHKAIVSAVDRAVRHGATLGLRSFTR